MRISIITLFPKMVSSFFEESIIKRAIDKKIVDIKLINLRELSVDSYGSVDDRPYGGGAGMVLRVEPIKKAIQSVISRNRETRDLNKKSNEISRFARNDNTSRNDKNRQKIVLTSPRGTLFSQKKAQEYSRLKHLIIIAGHYEGVDERVSSYIDEEISLGDFVMTGGEITAGAIVDSIVRLLPGVLKKEEATQSESFFEVDIEKVLEAVPKSSILDSVVRAGKTRRLTLLEYPHYTRPEEFDGKQVPKILLSGNHAEIAKWRIRKAFEETVKRRFDLLVKGKDL